MCAGSLKSLTEIAATILASGPTAAKSLTCLPIPLNLISSILWTGINTYLPSFVNNRSLSAVLILWM